MKKLLVISALFVFLVAVLSLRARSGQQGRANEDVEEFISYYCGEDTVGAFREQHPERLYAPRNAESDPYLACRQIRCHCQIKFGHAHGWALAAK